MKNKKQKQKNKNKKHYIRGLFLLNMFFFLCKQLQGFNLNGWEKAKKFQVTCSALACSVLSSRKAILLFFYCSELILILNS